MATMIIQIVYAVAALVGLELYAYAGWKAKKVPFDVSKVLDTFMSSGVIAMVGSAAGLAEAGISFGGLLAAFTMGAGLDTIANKMIKATKPSEEVK